MNANGLIVLMTKFLPQMQEEIRKNKREKRKCKNEYEMFDCRYVKKTLTSKAESPLNFCAVDSDSQTVTNNKLVKMERR